MSSGWSWFIIIITLVNIIGSWWLLKIYSKRRSPSDQPDTGHVWDDDLRELNNPLPRWWLWLFYITIIFSLIYLVLYPGLGAFAGIKNWTQLEQYENEVKQMEQRYSKIYGEYSKLSIEELADNKAAMKTGRRLYINNCSTCHGSDAGGAPGFPSLRDSEWLYGSSGEAIKQSISQGRSGVMPGWQAALGDDGVTAVIQYVRYLGGTKAGDSEDIKTGQQQYNTFCVVCHGVDGKGNELLGAPDLTNDIWLYGNSTQALRQSIALGRNGIMPAHNKLLNDDKIHVLTAYVYSMTKEQ